MARSRPRWCSGAGGWSPVDSLVGSPGGAGSGSAHPEHGERQCDSDGAGKSPRSVSWRTSALTHATMLTTAALSTTNRTMILRQVRSERRRPQSQRCSIRRFSPNVDELVTADIRTLHWVPAEHPRCTGQILDSLRASHETEEAPT